MNPNHSNSMAPLFDHEKLEVYQTSVKFIAWLEPLLEEVSGVGSARNQLERASISIPLNIAEGNGKFTGPDRCRYFDNARGSALESAAALDVLVAKRQCAVERVQPGKEQLRPIVSMLVGLIKSNSGYRMHEGPEAER